MPPLLPKPSDCDTCHGKPKLVIRDDDKEEVVKERMVIYHKQTSPLIDFYSKQGKLQEFPVKKGLDDTPRLFVEVSYEQQCEATHAPRDAARSYSARHAPRDAAADTFVMPTLPRLGRLGLPPGATYTTMLRRSLLVCRSSTLICTPSHSQISPSALSCLQLGIPSESK